MKCMLNCQRLQFKSSMGQKCCSDSNADKRVYDPSLDKVSKPQPATYESNGFQKNQNIFETPQHDLVYDIVRNFAPVDTVPKLHPNVREILDKIKQFHPTEQFQAPVGDKQTSAFAINNAGMIYEANSQWQDGVPHGWGKLHYPDGSLYDGTFIKGVPSGQGRFVSSQGWYYEGELFKEQAQGKGVFCFEDIGYKYQGQWEGDLPDGRGEETWVKVGKISTYKGQYVGGKKHGKGTYRCGDEWQYEGEFSDNELTAARGFMKYKNGEQYQGGFLNGKKHGFGIYRWRDGSIYQGWYSHDKKHGHGKFITHDNKRFEGEWSNGKRQGRGVLIIDGKKYPGQWRNDLPASSKQL